MNKKTIHMLAYLLLWIGGLNWGLVGLFQINLVTELLGGSATLVQLVYILVGLSAVYTFSQHRPECKVCKPKK